MNRRILLFMICCLIGSWSAKAQNVNEGILWEVSDENTKLTISPNPDAETEKIGIIPDGMITEWVNYRETITTIVIEEGITAIGASAFIGFNIPTITFPQSLKSIGKEAFSGCIALTSIKVPESVTNIGIDAFYGCSNLASIFIANNDPESIILEKNEIDSAYPFPTTSIIYVSAGIILDYYKITAGWKTYTIREGGVINNITWTFNEETLTFSGTGAIPDYEIQGHTVVTPWVSLSSKVKTLVIEEGITKIGNYNFTSFYSLTEVTIEGNTLTSIGIQALSSCTDLTKIDLSQQTSLTSIGESAFSFCPYLSEVSLPKSVTTIGPIAFNSVLYLTSFTVLNEEPVKITKKQRIFEGIDLSKCTLYVPAGSEAKYQAAEVWEEFKIVGTGGTTPTYHTLTLDVADGIDLYNFSAGNHQIEEGGHLYLQFLPEDRALGAADVLFLIDGVETEFRTLGDNNYFSYILNPIKQDHTILIALREYNVTLPEVEGVSYDVGAGTHSVAYGESFRFSLTLADGIDPAGVHVFANGIEIQPDALRAIVLSYTIDKVITSITIEIEGAKPTSNASLTHDIQLTINNGLLTIDNGIANPIDVAVYTIAGQNVMSLRALRGSKTITLQPGIYLIKAGNKVYKVYMD